MELTPRNSLKLLCHFAFAIVLIVFAALKFNHLFLPYFWDELGVYSQCAVYQYHHGISLMPNSLPAIISRGHPLLLTVMNASIMNVFGTSVVVPHTLHLFVSLVLLSSVYYYTCKFFNHITGLAAVVLLAVQPIFFMQSILLLPEVFISLLLFLALVFYFEEKFFLFAAFASLAILTKESAVVLPAACLSYSVCRWICFKNPRAPFLPLNLFLSILPYIVFGAFLIIQKIQMGWYFFPYHVDGIDFSLYRIHLQFNEYRDMLFWSQGRYWWKNILLLGLFAMLLFRSINRTSLRKSFVTPLVVFSTAFLIFSCISNFYMGRYTLVLIVILAIFTAVSLTYLLKNPYLITTAVLLLAVVAVNRDVNYKFEYDEDLGYLDCVATLQKAVQYCEEDTSSRLMVEGNFPAYYAFQFKEGGYLTKPDKFIPFNADSLTHGYYIKVHPGDDHDFDRTKLTAELVETYKQGYAVAEVYRLTRTLKVDI